MTDVLKMLIDALNYLRTAPLANAVAIEHIEKAHAALALSSQQGNCK